MGESAHVHHLASGLSTLICVLTLLCILLLGIVFCAVACCCRLISRRRAARQEQLQKEGAHAFGVYVQQKLPTFHAQDCCSVCLEAITPGDLLKLLPCGHSFHAKCIDVWLLRHDEDATPSCPLCKALPIPSLQPALHAESVAEQRQRVYDAALTELRRRR